MFGTLIILLKNNILVAEQLYYFEESIKQFDTHSRILKRRNYLMEKIKDSKTIGIVIGTLAVQNYLKIIERLKSLIKSRGKKYYLISVGKPTVAKLANFQEVSNKNYSVTF